MSESEEQKPQQVDETPISPIRPDAARKNSLENHLMHRPNRTELVESGIFHNRTKNLNIFRTENILPASSAAPGLLAHQKELERNMLEDKLNDKISHRPNPEDLVKEGVLREDPRSAEQKYEEAIEDEYAKREGGA
ncbi:RPEL repeat protein [Pochonia chlamydosporia 170]|uniref:RPEL repeat protein n=1 Tax=Pochonia chlamydosporia 170 TaxID=1380566 RepID=A0A179G7L0_METCM|nr:RPEL repeat protein [Pochonia chlamydosporia 170]OAQ73421.1 RPEL repeat protein [Pochonia chlamydosporia 170]